MRFYYRIERRLLGRIKSHSKKIYTSLKDYADAHTNISDLLIQFFKNVLIFFFFLNLLILIIFTCSLVLKKIRNLYKIRNLNKIKNLNKIRKIYYRSPRTRNRKKKIGIKLAPVSAIDSSSFGKIFTKSSNFEGAD